MLYLEQERRFYISIGQYRDMKNQSVVLTEKKPVKIAQTTEVEDSQQVKIIITPLDEGTQSIEF